MKYRQWFRLQIKKELRNYRGVKGALRKLGMKPTLYNQVHYALVV